jgi:hypothetical protein
LQTIRPNAVRAAQNDFKRLSFATISDSRKLCCSNCCPQPQIFLLISLWVLKNVEFDADFDPVKKITKKLTQKVIGQKRLHKDIKVKKQHFPSQWR